MLITLINDPGNYWQMSPMCVLAWIETKERPVWLFQFLRLLHISLTHVLGCHGC